MLAYNVALVALSVVAELLISDECAYAGACSSFEDVASVALSMIWLLLLLATIVLGWRGELPGCRRASTT